MSSSRFRPMSLGGFILAIHVSVGGPRPSPVSDLRGRGEIPAPSPQDLRTAAARPLARGALSLAASVVLLVGNAAASDGPVVQWGGYGTPPSFVNGILDTVANKAVPAAPV